MNLQLNTALELRLLKPINILIWNIRGACRKDSIRYSAKLGRCNKVSLLILVEPFSLVNRLESVKLSLHFQSTRSFFDGKIWIFWNNDYSYNLVESVGHLVHIGLVDASQNIFHFYAIYAKHSRVVRKPLWQCLENIGGSIQVPWAITGILMLSHQQLIM